MQTSPPPRSRFDFERLISPRSPLEFLGFAAVNALIGLISAGSPIGFVAVPALSAAWWWWDQRRDRQRRLGFVVEKKPPQAARGLILLLSPYNPRDSQLRAETLQPLIQRLLQQPDPSLVDFAEIGLFKSNLMPQIQAIDYHAAQGKLRDIWLITTLSYEAQSDTATGKQLVKVQGSEQAAEILVRYLQMRYGTDQFDIHTQGLTVQEWQYERVWQMAETIFKTSGYTHDVIVADVTGGTKMMSVALAMACIPPRRRMQYMDSQRDWQGNPIPQGEVKPLLIDVDPILYRANETTENQN